MKAARRAILWLASLLLTLQLGVGLAYAAPSKKELKRARKDYSAGLALEVSGNYSGALTKFEGVSAVKATPQVLYHIAFCQEKLGRWSEALGAYRMALARAEKEGAEDVVREVNTAREKLEAKIPKLTINLEPGLEGATIRLDGVVIGSTSIGREMLVDPGSHTIEAEVRGAGVSKQTVVLKEKEKKSIAMVPPEKDAPEPVVPVEPDKPPPSIEDDSGPGALPWIVMGVGGASLAASGVFFYLRSDTLNTLDENCYSDSLCPTSEQDTFDRGKTYTLLANVTLGVGAAGVATGVILLLATGGKKEASEQARTTTPQVFVTPGGAGVYGKF